MGKAIRKAVRDYREHQRPPLEHVPTDWWETTQDRERWNNIVPGTCQ